MLLGYKIEVGSEPVRLNSPSEPHRPDHLIIRNIESVNSPVKEVWLGPDSGVTPEEGLVVYRDEPPLHVTTGADEELWAVAEEGENEVELRVLCRVV